MGKNSKIEWCDHTFNPVIGCTRVSPGCVNCYAEAWAKRFSKRFWGEGNPSWGPGAKRIRTSKAKWDEVRRWNRAARLAKEQWDDAIHHHGDDVEYMSAVPFPTRPRVFAPSMSDWLDPGWNIQDLADFLALIHECQNLDFLLLTKRPGLWRDRVEQVSQLMERPGPYDFVARWLCGVKPKNVWVGTTVEDQRRADERIPELLKIPARERFLSCEPLLGPVDFSDVDGEISVAMQRNDPKVMGYPADFIDWVICGGESGPGARPMHPDWARSLRDQCQAAGVPFFFKQWGEWAPRTGPVFGSGTDWTKIDPQCRKWPVHKTCADCGETAWTDPPKSGCANHGDVTAYMQKVGKHRAGRMLDGREWNEFPAVK